MAAVPSTQQLLHELSELPPTVNPYSFLQDQITAAFAPATKYKTATEACAVIVIVVSAVSAVCAVIQLVQCFWHPQPFITKTSTKFGPLIRLNEDLVWSILMVVFCIAFELQGACLILDLYHKPKMWQIALRSSCFIVAEISGLYRATHSLLGALADCAKRYGRRSTFAGSWIAPVASSLCLLLTIGFPVAAFAPLIMSVIALQKAQTVGDEISVFLEPLATSWTTGDGFSILKLGALTPYTEQFASHLTSFDSYSKTFVIMLVASLLVLITLWTPAALYQLVVLTEQMSRIRTTSAAMSASRIAASQTSFNEFGTASNGAALLSPEARLLRLKKLCTNLILSSSLFLTLIFAVLPIGVLFIKAIDNIDADTTARLGLLQGIAGVIISIGVTLANVFLTRKSVLTTKMARDAAEGRNESKVADKSVRSPQPINISQIHVQVEKSYVKDDMSELDNM